MTGRAHRPRFTGRPRVLAASLLAAAVAFAGAGNAHAQVAIGTVLVADETAGTNGLGGLFAVDPGTGARTLLSDFGNPAQGALGVNPRRVAVTSAGVIYVADRNAGTASHGALFRVDLLGNRTVVSDFGNAAQGTLGDEPSGVAFTSTGVILVVDTAAGTSNDGALFTVDATTGARTVLSDFGNAAQGTRGLDPSDVAVTSTDVIRVIDGAAGTSGHGALFTVDGTTGARVVLSNFGVGAPAGNDPFGLTVATSPAILVADRAIGLFNRGALFTVDPTTGARTVLSDFENLLQGPLGVQPSDVAVSSGGTIFVIDADVGTGGRGVLFTVNATTGVRTILSNFGTASEGPLGSNPTGVTVYPVVPSICGNGILEIGEACDGGATNGVPPSCCSATCQFEAATTVCRSVAGVCDANELCTGTSATCPADVKSTSTCRPSAGICDVTEVCDGVSNDCPTDGFASSASVCRASAGVCDLAETCTGSTAFCPADAKSTAVCRGSAGVCDVAESCDGVTNTCPADGFASSASVCRASAGVCDLAENCTGSTPSCPADAKSTAVCRGSAGVCDVAETCDGVANSCPADGFASSASVCRPSAGVCDLADTCTGSTASCPADAKSTAVCRASAGVCDVTETCDGVANTCPADAFASSASVCRPSAGACDLADNCTGSAATCPADAKSTAVCRPSAGICDVTETCDGVANTCPADAFASSASVCRPSAGACDLADNCTGAGATCPADAKSTAECRASAGVCDLADNCDGVTDACPADAKSTAVCRPAAGDCDLAESCDGSANTCPANGFVSAGVGCGSAVTNACNDPDTCDGSGTCLTNVAAAGTPCDDLNRCSFPDVCDAGGNCLSTIPFVSGACIDDFFCYDVKVAAGQPPFDPPTNLPLTDEFQSSLHDVRELDRRICLPTQRDAVVTTDLDTHLLDYKIELTDITPHQPHHVPRKGIVVQNDLGTFYVDTIDPERLFVPAAKSRSGPVTEPDPSSHEVDHFECYQVQHTAGAPPDTVVGDVVLHDQFYPNVRHTIEIPRLYCNPTDKAGEGIKHGDNHLLCFSRNNRVNLCSNNTSITCLVETDCPGGVAGSTNFCPVRTDISPVYAADQFAAGTLTAVSGPERYLCVSSVATVPALPTQTPTKTPTPTRTPTSSRTPTRTRTPTP